MVAKPQESGGATAFLRRASDFTKMGVGLVLATLTICGMVLAGMMRVHSEAKDMTNEVRKDTKEMLEKHEDGGEHPEATAKFEAIHREMGGIKAEQAAQRTMIEMNQRLLERIDDNTRRNDGQPR